jgi:thymidylate synthase
MNVEIMNTLDGKYQELLIDILDSGVVKTDRTGTGTKSVFGRQIRHNMKQGFPLLTTKRMAWKTMVVELLWFLRGDTNIKYLVDNDCNIWNGDAFKRYNNTYKGNYPMDMTEFIQAIKNSPDFAREYGELGPIYGKQWRDLGGKIYTELSSTKGEDGFYDYVGKHIKGVDQIKNLIGELKTNPDSRRLMVNAWNVGELDQMVLPPCHYGFQVWTRELNLDERIDLHNKGKINTSSDYLDWQLDQMGVPQRYISLMWNQRSVDTFLGLPFNIASYGLLLMMIADEVNMIPDELIGNLGDVHLYLNHIEQAEEQIKRDPFNLPTVHVRDGIYCSSINDVILENYISHPSIKAPLSN